MSNDDKIKYKIKKRERSKSYRESVKNTTEFKIKERKRRRDRHFRKLETNPLYKIRIAYVRRLNKCIKRFSVKNVNFLENLGCSLNEFKIYLESRFENWMSWENYGKYNGEFNYGWDIDHIIPISSASTEMEFYKLCHYTNLQPLCSKTNRDIKKDKLKNPQ